MDEVQKRLQQLFWTTVYSMLSTMVSDAVDSVWQSGCSTILEKFIEIDFENNQIILLALLEPLPDHFFT